MCGIISAADAGYVVIAF